MRNPNGERPVTSADGGGHRTEELLAGALPQTGATGIHSSKLIDAAKQYFSDMYKEHDIQNHVACQVVHPDTRTAGWEGHGDLQPGVGVFLVAYAINDRAQNPETYEGNGLKLQISLQRKAKDDPTFRKLLEDTALLTLYQRDIAKYTPDQIELRNLEDAVEQSVLDKAPIQAPSVTLKHIVPKMQEEVARQMGVELAPVQRGGPAG